MPLLIALLAAGQAAAPPPDPPLARMVALYDEVCLQAFPDDTKVAALLTAKGATPLSDHEVKVILRDDPGRGWRVGNGDAAADVVLEAPPFHACSVRLRRADPPVDLSGYRAAVGRFVATHPGFAAQPPMAQDRGGIRMHAEYQARALPDGRGEALMVIDQQITDPGQLGRGETAPPLRFVHQIMAAR